jgi:cytochrome P450
MLFRDDLPKLTYLTMCLKEALRLHTPVPFIERQTTQDMTIEGYFLPAGALIDIHLYVLHHNPEVWDDPEEFRPDRFSDENSQKQSHFAFLPFSAGPRLINIYCYYITVSVRLVCRSIPNYM